MDPLLIAAGIVYLLSRRGAAVPTGAEGGSIIATGDPYTGEPSLLLRTVDREFSSGLDDELGAAPIGGATGITISPQVKGNILSTLGSALAYFGPVGQLVGRFFIQAGQRIAAAPSAPAIVVGAAIPTGPLVVSSELTIPLGALVGGEPVGSEPVLPGNTIERTYGQGELGGTLEGAFKVTQQDGMAKGAVETVGGIKEFEFEIPFPEVGF